MTSSTRTELPNAMPHTTATQVPLRRLQRTMDARHLVMIALGGVIGSGLFLSSGYTIGVAGPLGAIIAYLIGAFVVWLVIGLVIYFAYGRKHSLMNPDSPRRVQEASLRG